jgi:hypothetical protein
MGLVAEIFAGNRYVAPKRESVRVAVVGLHLTDDQRLLVGIDVAGAQRAAAVFSMDLAAKSVELVFECPRAAFAYRYDPADDVHAFLHPDGVTHVRGTNAQFVAIENPHARSYERPLRALAISGGTTLVGGASHQLFVVRDGKVTTEVARPHGMDAWEIHDVLLDGAGVVVGDDGGEVLGGDTARLERLVAPDALAAIDRMHLRALHRRSDGRVLVAGKDSFAAAFEIEGGKLVDLRPPSLVPVRGPMQAVVEYRSGEVWVAHDDDERLYLYTRGPSASDRLVRWTKATTRYENTHRAQAFSRGEILVVGHAASIHVFDGVKWTKIVCTIDVNKPFKRLAGSMRSWS